MKLRRRYVVLATCALLAAGLLAPGQPLAHGSPDMSAEDNRASTWLSLDKPGVQRWNFSYISNPAIGLGAPTLQIAPTGSLLNLYLPDEPGGMRLYLWPSTIPVPDLPHTQIKPTMAVYGDLLIGDIICIARNPMTLFMRQETGLPASAVTQFFSARDNINDVDGGAAIVMAPDQTGAVDSGWITLVAYGQGTGPIANSILFKTRSGPNSVADRMIINARGNVGIGTNSPAGKLDVNGSVYQHGGVLHADYVFEPDYALRSIEEHAEQMWSKKTLPALPVRRLDDEGREMVDLGAQQRALLEELETAHIYIEQLNRRIKELERTIDELRRITSDAESRVHRLGGHQP